MCSRVFRCMAHPVVFRLFCCAAIFKSILLACEMEELGWKQSNHWCSEKHITVATHFSRYLLQQCAHRLAGHEPSLSHSRICGRVAGCSALFWSVSWLWTDFIILPWRSTRNFTEEANAYNFWNLLVEQHVY